MGFLHREPVHSKGSGGSDQLILGEVVSRMRERGCELVAVPQPRRGTVDLPEVDLLVTMSRTIEVASALAAVGPGLRVVNDPAATLMTLRENLYARLVDVDVAVPATHLIDLSAPPSLRYPLWIKRKDYHHILPEDVQMVRDHHELEAARDHFAAQGYRMAFAQEHVDGRRVKFYGVYDREAREVRYLCAQEPADDGLLARLRALAHAVLAAIPLEVFGADVLVSGDEVWLVDVNSWPSFKSCRDEAAEAIAAYLCELAARVPG